MGIGQWIARKGNVGGTARWAGNAYLSIKQRSPNATIEQIMGEIVSVRYLADAASREREALLSIIEKGEMRGLAHLVTNILNIEAGFSENTQKNRLMFMGIIQEELAKQGVPDVDIWSIPTS